MEIPRACGPMHLLGAIDGCTSGRLTAGSVRVIQNVGSACNPAGVSAWSQRKSSYLATPILGEKGIR